MPDLTNFTPGRPLETEALPADAPEWAHVLYRQQVQIMETMNATMRTIDAAAAEITPLVDSLSSSPMVRMLGGGKR